MTSVLAPKIDNRRDRHRHQVQVPLRYRVAGGGMRGIWKRGRTLNMSCSGVLIETTEKKEVGTRLELAMDWTGLYHDKPQMRLFISGVVVRSDRHGTALRMTKHRFAEIRPAIMKQRLAVVA